MSQVPESWIAHLRKTCRQDSEAVNRMDSSSKKVVICLRCKAEVPPDISKFRRHVLENVADHGSLTEEMLKAEFDSITLKPSTHSSPRPGTHEATQSTTDGIKPPHRTPNTESGSGISNMNGDQLGRKTSYAPSPIEAEPRLKSRSSSQTPRSRARQPESEFDRGTQRRPPSRPLFDPQAYSTTHRPKDASQPKLVRQSERTPHQPDRDASDSFDGKIDPNRPHTSILPQPQTKPISQEQLVAEVKGIYAGLVMIEGKCIEADNTHSQTDTAARLSEEQWTALICLHRTLLREHHDFFLASQHPSANSSLRRLAIKYAMPARMWRHGIHSFLALLRHKLPSSYDHMLTFIYAAYSMMALLYETVPAFEDTWIECLGDLARYRMAIEEEDLNDREIWAGVAQHWYRFASEKSPTTGRLYHHLAILARPNAMQQLYYYSKSLCVPIPWSSARDSILSLFGPLYDTSKAGPLGKVRNSRTTDSQAKEGDASAASEIQPSQEPDEIFGFAKQFAMRTYEIVVQRWGDPNTLPFIHTFLVFMYHVSCSPGTMKHLEKDFPWKLTAVMLNCLHHTCKSELRIDSEVFPSPLKNDHSFAALHGVLYSKESRKELHGSMNGLLKKLDSHIRRVAKCWLNTRHHTALGIGLSHPGYEDSPVNRTKYPFWKSSGTGTNQGLDSGGHYEALYNSALSAFRQICKTISFSTSIRLLLPIFWAVSVSADTGGEQKSIPQMQYDPDLPRWFYPALFAMIGLYVEGAGRYYNERHKWYTMFMAVANLAFPWLVEHEDVSPSLTCSVFGFAVYLICAYGLMDYEEMRPSPMFYVVVTFLGLAISAMISTFSQPGGSTGFNTSAGVNTFSIYLLFGMTLSAVVCGRMLAACRAWIAEQRTFSPVTPAIQYV